MMIRRRAFGVLLLLHGLAHILPGMRVTTAIHWWITGDSLLAAVARWTASVSFWSIAVLGFTAAGLGRLGVPRFEARWRQFVAAGACASLVLLGVAWRTPLALPGIAIDLILLVAVRRVPEQPTLDPSNRKRPHHFGAAMGSAYLLLLGVLLLAYPWHMRWGSAESELRAALPGDESASRPTYLIQHAVTIRAPAAVVWPWLAQLGGNRGGFYSYSWLENFFGLHIRNADRIHPEWQQLSPGDSVFATPKGWLGFDQPLGWRVSRAEPSRVLVLEDWGAFLLQPVGLDRTRLIVRTRASEPDRMANLLLAPLDFLVFEPAHFIMERKMLLEIRRRAEFQVVPSTTLCMVDRTVC